MTRAYHCSFLERDGAFRTPCRTAATTSWWNTFGWRLGSCDEHVAEMAQEGKGRGWIPEGPITTPTEEAA